MPRNHSVVVIQDVQMFYLGIFGRITVGRVDYASNDDLVHSKL